jgi:hypothetical protein
METSGSNSRNSQFENTCSRDGGDDVMPQAKQSIVNILAAYRRDDRRLIHPGLIWGEIKVFAAPPKLERTVGSASQYQFNLTGTLTNRGSCLLGEMRDVPLVGNRLAGCLTAQKIIGH